MTAPSGSSAADMHPIDAATDAVRGFTADLAAFRGDLDARLSHQSRRLDALDRAGAARPGLSLSAQAGDAPHTKAMTAYLRRGDDQALRGLALDTKALSTAVSADGGYLVDPQTSETIQARLHATSSIRSIATVVSVDAGSYDVLIDESDFAAVWQTETADSVETATPTIDRISIPLHELSALPKASQRLLEDSAFDLEAWLAERIAERFARAENSAFISGDGIDQPMGFLSHTAVDNSAWLWGSIGYVATGVSGDFATSSPADALLDLVYSLGAGYRRQARFVMNSTTASEVRKFKDSDGRYLWSEAMAEDHPPRLFGYPVVIAEEMPDIAADAQAIAFGDFQSGYVIAERPELRVLRDPFSAKPHVLFYATKRVGGDVVDFGAIKTLRFSLA